MFVRNLKSFMLVDLGPPTEDKGVLVFHQFIFEHFLFKLLFITRFNNKMICHYADFIIKLAFHPQRIIRIFIQQLSDKPLVILIFIQKDPLLFIKSSLIGEPIYFFQFSFQICIFFQVNIELLCSDYLVAYP